MAPDTVGRRGEVEVNGARLAFEVGGDGSPVVCLHAGVADRRMWDGQFAAFARRHRTVRYDCRGFGESTQPPGPFAHRDDLVGLLDHLGLGRVHLVACSMAGRIAAEVALAWPARVASLVLVNCGLAASPSTPEVRPLMAAIDAAYEAGDLARTNELELQLWVDGPARTPADVDPAVRERVREMNGQVLELAVENEARPEAERSTPTWLDPAPVERLVEIAAPTLVVLGGLDLPGVRRNADRLAAGIPGARLATIPDAAHLAPLERPARFNRLTLELLAAVSG